VPAAGRLPGDERGRPAAPLPAAATDLKGIIDRTRFAISNEETRYYLNGIYFHAAKAGAPTCCAASPPTAIGWPRGGALPKARATFRA